MRQFNLVGRRSLVGIAAIALASAIYVVLGLCGVFEAFWGSWQFIAEAEKGLERGDLDSALKYANRAVQCNPNRWTTYDARAQVREARGELHESLQDYTKVVSLGYHLALADRGRVYEKMGELDNAAADHCQALRTNRRNSGRSVDVSGVALHRVMGPGEYNIDRYPNAVPLLLKFFDEAIERKPDNQELRECRELIVQGMEK